MDQIQKENNIIKQLYKNHHKNAEQAIPAFADIFGKAQKKHLKMKRIKWTVITAIIGLSAVIGYSNIFDKEPANIENIEVARAGIDFYETLMKDGKIVVHDIYFDYDNARVRPSSMGLISKIAKMMKKHPDIVLSIEGHTDSDGSSTYNLNLSEARAAAVKGALAELNIDAKRLSARGLGEANPISSNKSESGKAMNRRVEFVKK